MRVKGSREWGLRGCVAGGGGKRRVTFLCPVRTVISG